MKKRHYYDDEEFDYQRYWQNRVYEDLSEKDVLATFFQKIEKEFSLSRARLLDVGAGFGRLASFYLPLVKEAVLVEPSFRLRQAAKEKLKKFTNYRLVGATIEAARLGEEKFDVVLMIRVFHHLFSPRLAIRRIKKTLKPGGFFILEFPNKLHARNLLRLIFSGRTGEIFSLRREDKRSAANIQKGSIPFFNYHPRWVIDLLRKEGFGVGAPVSVSNWRAIFFKKLFSPSTLLRLEKATRPLFSCFNFGPSIFLLCQKE